MTYADLIKVFEPYADEEMYFNGYENRTNTEVEFYCAGGIKPILVLSRTWGKKK